MTLLKKSVIMYFMGLLVGFYTFMTLMTLFLKKSKN